MWVREGEDTMCVLEKEKLLCYYVCVIEGEVIMCVLEKEKLLCVC